MVVSPLRAMTQARLELIWNSVTKGSGALSALAGVFILIAGVACLVPPYYMFTVFGSQLGDELPVTGSAAMIWLASLHALLVFGLGGAAGMRQRRGFDREFLRSLPLRPSQLLLAELPFGLVDTIPMLSLAFFAGLGVGLGRTLPGTMAPMVLLVALLGVAGVLLIQQMVGVVRRLVSRPRFLATGVAIATVPTLAVAALATTKGVGPAYALVVDWLPTTMGYHGLQALAQGKSASAAGFLLLAIGFIVSLFAVTAWLQWKELAQDPRLRVAKVGDNSLWTFRNPTVGLARLFAVQVLGSSSGKLLLSLPVFCTGMFVIIAGIIERSAVGRDPSGLHLTIQTIFDKTRSYPLYLLVPPLVVILSRELWMNQFAWHGRGIKALFLAPIPSTDILNGKLLGLALVQLPQALFACLPLVWLAIPDPAEIASGLAIALFVVTALGTLGHVLSVRFPRAAKESGEGATAAPPTLQLLSTFAVLGAGVVALAGHTGLASLHPWAPPVGFVALAGMVLLFRAVMMPRLEKELDAGRENLSETIG